MKIDDGLETHRLMGRPPRLSDSELVTLAVAQSLLGFSSETRRLRYAKVHLVSMFPYLPHQSGYNKRLKREPPKTSFTTSLSNMIRSGIRGL